MNQLKVICYDLLFVHIRMSYYWFNRQELLQRAKDKYYITGGKEESAEYCITDKDVLKEKTRNKYRNSSKEEKEAKREYGRNKYRNMKMQANRVLKKL